MESTALPAAVFARDAAPLLDADPIATNLLAVRLAEALREPWGAGRAEWVVAREGSRTVGAAMRTPPHPVVLSPMPIRAAALLGERFAAGDARVVNGPAEVATAFAAAWAAATGGSVTVGMRTRLFRLHALHPPAGVAGEAELASMPDAGRVVELFERFHREAVPDEPPVDRERTTAKVRAGSILLWKVDGSIVSMAGTSPAAGGVARIGPVYTPPDERRRGFGAAVTAAAAADLLDRGATQVALYTDLANPTSNAIYRAIGFVPHLDFTVLHLDPDR